MALPRVISSGEKPFVFASRFPNGAAAVAAQERACTARAWYMPAAEVEVHVGDARGLYGVFGSFTRLTLVFDRSLRGRRVTAQDLAGEEAIDVTDHVCIDGRSLQLTEANLQVFGLRAATEGDLSSPGLVLALR